MFLIHWYLPDGGLDISASAYQLAGTTIAFEDSIQIVGYAFNSDLSVSKEGVSVGYIGDSLLFKYSWNWGKMKETSANISWRWNPSSFSTGRWSTPSFFSQLNYQHSGRSAGGRNWTWGKHQSMNIVDIFDIPFGVAESEKETVPGIFCHLQLC